MSAHARACPHMLAAGRASVLRWLDRCPFLLGLYLLEHVRCRASNRMWTGGVLALRPSALRRLLTGPLRVAEVLDAARVRAGAAAHREWVREQERLAHEQGRLDAPGETLHVCSRRPGRAIVTRATSAHCQARRHGSLARLARLRCVYVKKCWRVAACKKVLASLRVFSCCVSAETARQLKTSRNCRSLWTLSRETESFRRAAYVNSTTMHIIRLVSCIEHI